MQLKNYQDDAIAELLIRSQKLLRQNGNKVMVFKAPTGSGKTIVIAEFLARLINIKSVNSLAFIWIAPRKLYAQSYQKLERYYENSQALDCVYFHELTDRQIGNNQILFVNWESIRQENKNTIVRENEHDNYLGKVLENTTEAKRSIVLIIDESHIASRTDLAKRLIDNIKPKLTIEVSATPILTNHDEMFSVPLEEVKREYMIKQSVIINAGYKNTLSHDGITPAFKDRSDIFVLDQALAKRQQLAAAFTDATATVNPLLCIQLPDRRIQQDEEIKNTVVQHLKKCGITVDNGKLAIWLSGEHENKENISVNDNEVEVLIFKHAISVGWDCPRAHILVLFRATKSIVFSVQTLGRIMRMPEPQSGQYENEILNKGYVYTNLPKVTVQEEIAGGYVHIFTAKRNKEYCPLKLCSVHSLRQREQTRLSPKLVELFIQAADEYKLVDKINLVQQTVQDSYISDYENDNIDSMIKEKIENYNQKINVTHDADLQKLLDYFVLANLSPFYPEERSIARVKEAIYKYFKKPLLIDVAECLADIVNIVLSEENLRHFVEVLGSTMQSYKKTVAIRKEPLQETKSWEVPESITYNENYCECRVRKSVMQPFYVPANHSIPEKKFIELLEQSDKVRWWYQNGASESMYFAVPYTQNGELKSFYVDFIVCLKDGRIGLFDTKSGFTIDTAGDKSDGLLAYIQHFKARRKQHKLFGGIVTSTHKEFAAEWKIYTGTGTYLTSQDLVNSHWQPLDL